MKNTLFLLPVVLCTLISQSHAAPVAWQRDWRTASQIAARQNKPILLLVTASWCGPCHRMLQQSFPNSAVAARVNSQFVPLVVDVDQQTELVRELRVESMPTLFVMDSQGRVLSRRVGFLSAAELNAHLAAFPTQRSHTMGLASRPPIDTSRWWQSRKVWLPVIPPWETPVDSPMTTASPPSARLADAFPRLMHSDTLTAARSFGATHNISVAAEWGIVIQHHVGSPSEFPQVSSLNRRQ